MARAHVFSMAIWIPLNLGGVASCSLWPTVDIECMQSGRCAKKGPPGEDAVLVFGQPDSRTQLQRLNGLSHPTHAIRVGHKLVIADQWNSRVVIKDDPTSTTDDGPDVVLGQPDFSTGLSNYGGVSATSLYYPHSVASDGTRLFVADAGNSRVMIWNSMPTQNHQPADLVLGAADFTGGKTGISDHTFTGDIDVAIGSNNELLVTDKGNNRVLVFTRPITNNYQSADVVIGQPDMNSSNSNGGQAAPNANGFKNPIGSAFAAEGKYGVVDSSNHRVLFFGPLPMMNNATAQHVIGQSNFTSNTSNAGGLLVSELGLDTPHAAAGLADGTFAVADGNARILLWRAYPNADGVPASTVIGQPSFATSGSNYGGLNVQSLSIVEGLSWSGTDLFAADTLNNRVLMYRGFPADKNPPAYSIVGQPTYTVADPNNAGPISGNVYGSSAGVAVGGGRLAISDCSNSRVLLWDSIPQSGNTPPSLALGQQDLYGTTRNHGDGRASATGFDGLAQVWTDGTRIAADDTNRVLIWNTWPTTGLTSAAIVLGQPNKQVVTQNTGGISAQTLWDPGSMHFDGTHFFVADTHNHRVLIWNQFPTTDGQPADVVVGQTDFVSNSGNQGYLYCALSMAVIAADKLACPTGVTSDGTRLYVADQGNNRVLIWNTIPTTNGVPADVVLGQPSFSDGQFPPTVSLSDFRSVINVLVHNGRLYVSDPSGNRVLYWNSPTRNYQPADGIIGQPTIVSELPNAGGLTGNRLSTPIGLAASDDLLFIADAANSRIVANPHP